MSMTKNSRFKQLVFSIAMALSMMVQVAATAAPLVPSSGRTGTPKKIKCFATAQVADQPITAKTDVNVLLSKSKKVILGTVNPICAKYEGDVSGTCQAIIDTGKLYMRYANNSQNGSISIDDNVSGQSAYQSWYTQFKITKSGYLAASAQLTNTAGGIGGDPSIFMVDFSCQALSSDW